MYEIFFCLLGRITAKKIRYLEQTAKRTQLK